MSYITRGYTLTDGLLGDYTSTHLHQLVDSAAVTAIAMTEFDTTAHVVQVAGSTPGSDQGDGSLWYDSALGILRDKKGNARWDCQYVGPEVLNNTGAALPNGAWVTMSGDALASKCATGMWPEVVGALTAAIANGSKGIVRQKGLGNTLLIGPVTFGDVLISAGHGVFSFGDGFARSLHATGISNATLGVPIGMALASVASGFTALGSCVIWR